MLDPIWTFFQLRRPPTPSRSRSTSSDRSPLSNYKRRTTTLGALVAVVQFHSVTCMSWIKTNNSLFTEWFNYSYAQYSDPHWTWFSKCMCCFTWWCCWSSPRCRCRRQTSCSRRQYRNPGSTERCTSPDPIFPAFRSLGQKCKPKN